MTFKELKFRTHAENDVQAWTDINGYDVSIVRNQLSYGGEKGLYEIGVYKDDEMVDPLNWGDTVKGWLTPEGVEKELDLMERLKSDEELLRDAYGTNECAKAYGKKIKE